MAKRTRDLLDSLLVDRQMSAEQLNALVAEGVLEDLLLDYKDGRELADAKKAGRTLRQYMSGFANSDGGVLIIGVNDRDWIVTGCPAPGGGLRSDHAHRGQEWPLTSRCRDWARGWRPGQSSAG